MVDYSEILLVLGAVVIFSIAVLNVNQSIARNDTYLMTSELEYEAVPLAQQVIDAARSSAFDEAAVSGMLYNIPSDFTSAANFGGAGEGETYPAYDDIDDYHGLSVTDTTQHGIYTINAQVMYVTESNPETDAGSKTSYKRLDVSVSSQFLPDTVRLSYVKAW